MRSGAGTSYQSLLVIPAGASVTNLNKPLVPADGYEWREVCLSKGRRGFPGTNVGAIQISYQGTTGWAADEYLDGC